MGNFILGEHSLQRLVGVHPDLIKVVKRAIEITSIDFTVLEGLRTIQRQQELLDHGATTTLHSRHLTGHAVDLAPVIKGEVRWDWPLYHILAQVVKQAAHDLDISIEWGGSWVHFKDGPHFQLPWDEYQA